MMIPHGLPNLRWFLLAAALLLVSQPAFAAKRVALIIGNSAYRNVPALTNPVNDGAVIAATLKEAGFDVVDSRHDLPAVETRRALRDFADRARDADIAVIYYAGHGMEVDGTNCLRSTPNWNATPTCSTKRFRWTAYCWRSSRPGSFGW
jgi:hypothetical protein